MPFLISLTGFSMITFNSWENDDDRFASNRVFIKVSGASKIMAMYLAETALIEYLKNLLINGRSFSIFALNT